MKHLPNDGKKGKRKSGEKFFAHVENERASMAAKAPARECEQYIFDNSESVLRALLFNPALQTSQLIRILRRRNLPEDIFQLAGVNSRLSKDYRVKLELVKNPSAPKHVTLKFIKHLYIQDLAIVASNVNIPPVVRAAAEEHLKIRLDDLETGDKISLAKKAPAALIPRLLKEEDPRVIGGLMLNSRLKEDELLARVNDKKTPVEVLTEISRSGNWASRYKIKLALCRNPQFPEDLLLNFIDGVLLQDLLGMMTNPYLPLKRRLNARSALIRKIKKMTVREKSLMCRTKDKHLLDILMHYGNARVVANCLKNPNVLEGQVVSLAKQTSSDSIRNLISSHPLWKNRERVRYAIAENDHSNSRAEDDDRGRG